jgi:hypothetical protein
VLGSNREGEKIQKVQGGISGEIFNGDAGTKHLRHVGYLTPYGHVSFSSEARIAHETAYGGVVDKDIIYLFCNRSIHVV